MKHVWNFIRGSWKDLLIAAFLISFAAALNASMDTIEHHFNQSIFKDMDPYFEKDWKRGYEKDPITGELLYPLQWKQWNLGLFKMDIHPLFFDAWHLFKSAVIFLIILFGATFIFAQERRIFRWDRLRDWIILGVLIVIYSAAWILTFNLFYDHWLLL